MVKRDVTQDLAATADRPGWSDSAIDGLDVIEGNEGGPRPLICEA